jgi:hypothetical protein
MSLKSDVTVDWAHRESARAHLCRSAIGCMDGWWFGANFVRVLGIMKKIRFKLLAEPKKAKKSPKGNQVDGLDSTDAQGFSSLLDPKWVLSVNSITDERSVPIIEIFGLECRS